MLKQTESRDESLQYWLLKAETSAQKDAWIDAIQYAKGRKVEL